MIDSDMFFRTHVRAVVDSFDLEAVATDRTRVTRTTEVVLAGRCRTLKSAAVYLGLKIVHRYVFKNWGLLARKERKGGRPNELTVAAERPAAAHGRSFPQALGPSPARGRVPGGCRCRS